MATKLFKDQGKNLADIAAVPYDSPERFGGMKPPFDTWMVREAMRELLDQGKRDARCAAIRANKPLMAAIGQVAAKEKADRDAESRRFNQLAAHTAAATKKGT